MRPLSFLLLSIATIFPLVASGNPDSDNIDIVTIWDRGPLLGIVDGHRYTNSGRCENIMQTSKGENKIIAFANAKCVTMDSQVSIMKDAHGTKIARVTSGVDMGTGTPHLHGHGIEDTRHYYIAYIKTEKR